jgi:ABC-type uncharacterized transport system substrate-binding protein
MNSTLRKLFVSALATVLLMTASSTEAQEAKVYRIGVITAGGAWYEVIDGLRAGLKQLGLERENNLSLQSGIRRAI